MSYVVLARKYRPQTFSEIYSQDHITQILSNAIKSNRVAQAYLFTGPRGVGKTSMARILAKSLNCVNGPTVTPCGICGNCLEITSTTSPDVREIDGASNTGVDDVRELQQELVYIPIQSKYKIYIIDEVHMLSKSAFNALLKTLEEPPENVVFIFATTEPQKVLPTIISRCQRFDFRRIPVDDISARLKEIAVKEKINIDEESIFLIARKSDGGMRDALSLMDQVISFSDDKVEINQVREVFGELPLQVFANLLLSIYNKNAASLIQNYHTIVNQGIDVVEFLNSLLEVIRNIVMIKISVPLHGIAKEDLQLLTEMGNANSLNNILYMMSMVIQLKQDVKFSTHPTLLIESALIKMSRMEEMEDLGKIIARLDNMQGIVLPIHQELTSQPVETLPVKEIPSLKTSKESIEIDYTPPKNVKELTLEHVQENWDAFIKLIKPSIQVVALYMKKEYISSVKSDVIFMDFELGMQYKMVNNAKDTINDMLSKFFGLPVKLILRLKEPALAKVRNIPTLQDIKKDNPDLAELIETTNSLIFPQ